MKRSRKIFALFAFTALCLAEGVLRADDLAVEARVDRNEISMNDTLNLQLILSGGNINAGRPELPPIPGFRVTASGQSQNYSFVNGQVSSQVTFNFALAPEAPGDYTIPAMGFQSNGKTYSTQPIPVKVVSGSAPAAAHSGAEPPKSGAQHEDIFLTASVDKKSPLVGEPVTLTVRFFTRLRLLGQPSYQPPETTGFIIEDLPPQKQYTQSVGGRNYSVVELKYALFAAAPGKAAVGAAALECRIDDGGGRDPFEAFFQGFMSGGRPVTLRSDPIHLTVRALPEEGRPANFKGDVGQYAVSAFLDKKQAQLHEPLTLTVTVSGKGNVKTLSAPALPDMPGFKTYETLNSLNIDKKDYQVQGSKVFKTIVKPDVSGRLEIPPIAFSFYDPAAKAYRTVKSQLLSVDVKPGAVSDAAPGPNVIAPQEGVKVVGRDIRFIRRENDLDRKRRPFTRSPLYVILNILPALAFAILGAGRRLKAGLFADSPERRARLALGAAQSALRKILAHRGEKNLPAFYGHLQKIFQDYLAAKLRRPAQGLTWDAVEEAMAGRGAGGLKSRARGLWDDLDRVRYTPSLLSDEEARRHADELKSLLKELEASWKK